MPELAKIKAFAQEARAFCDWVTGANGSQMTATATLEHIAGIFAAALRLPRLPDGSPPESAEMELPAGGLERVRERAAQLPMQAYHVLFDPLETPPQEPVMGDLADDLVDIYAGVSHALALYDAGRVEEAHREWCYNFRAHWGEYATGAIRALQSFIVDE